MANTTYDTIKNMKPAPWSRSTVADGNALNQNFLEPTHQKDLTLAAAIDQVKNTVDGYNETINNISNVADAAKTQATNAISAANEAQDDVEALQTTVTEMSDAVSAHGESIETLGNNFNTLSAAVASESEAITNLQNNKQDKIYVDANTISGNGTSDSPYTVIGGNQKELEFVDSTTVTVHKDEQDDKIIYSFSAAGGGGGGTSYDMAWIPSVAQNGDISWTWGEYTTAPETRNIKGPEGQQGIQGPAGPQGPSGASGAKGEDGFSPTVTTAGIEPTTEHPQGGTSVTITDKTGEHQFDVWNGINGEGASVNFLDGNGIHVQQDGINYTISVSADYSGAAVTSAKNWVNAQGYVLSGALNPENSISGKWRNGQYYDFGLKASAENALAAVGGKITKPAASQSQLSYVVWDKGPAQEWTDFNAAASNWATNFLFDETSPIVAGNNGLSAGLVPGEFFDVYNIGLTQTAYNAITSVSGKVDKPDTSLVDKYLVLRTDNAGNVSGWYDLQEQSYSKSEANDRFVATANIDTTTLSGNGKSANTKLGVKTDIIATKDYVNSSFLPLSGGTVSGLTTISGSNFDNTLEIKRGGQNNNYAHIGLNSSRGLSFKAFDDNQSNNIQLDMFPNQSNNNLVQVQHNGTTVGSLIPALIHQGSYTPTSDDGILHIVLES